MKRAEVVELLAFAQALIPSYRMPTNATELDLVVDVWHRQLVDLDAALVTATLEAAAAGESREFVLNAAQLRARATSHLAGRAPSVEEAWGEVKHQIRHHGWPGAALVTFTHPAIAAVVNALGWQTLCESTNEVADRAHFARMYDARVDADRAHVAIPPAARAVLDQYAPAALERGVTIAGELEHHATVHQLHPTSTAAGVDEPTIEPGEARERLAATIAKLRIHKATDLDDDQPRRAFTWQEGDDIDLAHRGVARDVEHDTSPSADNDATEMAAPCEAPA